MRPLPNPSLHRRSTAGFAVCCPQVNSNVKPHSSFQPIALTHAQYTYPSRSRVVTLVRPGYGCSRGGCGGSRHQCMVASGSASVQWKAGVGRGGGVVAFGVGWSRAALAGVGGRTLAGRPLRLAPHAKDAIGSVALKVLPNPSFQPTCYGWLRQPPPAGELKR